MSDEPAAEHAAAPATTTRATPETPADAWGQPISPERQVELKALAERQREWATKPPAERGESAFQGVWLSGADVSWLAEQGEDGNVVLGVPYLRLEGADLRGARLERANLLDARLERAVLLDAHLDGANLRGRT